MTGPAESWVHTSQAHIPLTLCSPGIMKTDVLFLKAHPVPTYLCSVLAAFATSNLQYPVLSLMLMHIFVWTEFQGVEDILEIFLGIAEVWEGFGRAGIIWGAGDTLDLSFCSKQAFCIN